MRTGESVAARLPAALAGNARRRGAAGLVCPAAPGRPGGRRGQEDVRQRSPRHGHRRHRQPAEPQPAGRGRIDALRGSGTADLHPRLRRGRLPPQARHRGDAPAGVQGVRGQDQGLPRPRPRQVARLPAGRHARPLARPGRHRGHEGRQGRLLREAADADRRGGAGRAEGGQGDRPRLPDRQPAADRVPRHVPPGGRAGPRRPHRQGQDDRVPHRRQPDERPDPGGAGPRGAELGHLARPDAEGAVPQEGPPDELPLRVPLVVRVLRRQDDRLGRPPPRHRPVGPGHGRQRARRRRGARRRRSPTRAATATTATRASRCSTPTPTAPR